MGGRERPRSKMSLAETLINYCSSSEGAAEKGVCQADDANPSSLPAAHMLLSGQQHVVNGRIVGVLW